MRLPLLLTLLVLIGISCRKTETPLEAACPERAIDKDALFYTGLLGEWEIFERSSNGVSSTVIICCEMFSFLPDDNPDDLNGIFHYTGNGEDAEGTFFVDSANQEIHFEYGFEQMMYKYDFTQSVDILDFDYVEDQDQMTESWSRVSFL